MKGPKDIEEKLRKMLNAWEELAKDKIFGGMTQAQFQAIAAPALAVRAEIADLELQLKQQADLRDQLDEIALAKAQLVVNGVLADPTEGEDSTLYGAMGYTRKSDRKSGLTRKASGQTPPKT